MVNKFYYKKALKFSAIIFVLLLSSARLIAQESKGFLEVRGKVQQNGKGLEGASLKIYKGNEPIDDILTNAGGRFILNLDYNYNYTLVFSKKGAITKSLLIDSKIPDEEKNEIGFFEFKIDLFSILEDSIQDAMPAKPVAKISFDNRDGMFTYDEKYSDARKGEFEQIKKDQEAAVAKARQDSIDNAKAQASALSRAAALEKARQDSINKAKALADKAEAAEKARLAALEKAQRDSIAKAEADSLAKARAEEKTRLAALEKARQDSLAQAKAEEAARAKQLADSLAKANAEEKARLAALDKARQDSITRAKAE